MNQKRQAFLTAVFLLGLFFSSLGFSQDVVTESETIPGESVATETEALETTPEETTTTTEAPTQPEPVEEKKAEESISDLPILERIKRAQKVRVSVTQAMNLSISPFEKGKKVLSGKIKMQQPSSQIKTIEFKISSQDYGTEWVQQMSWHPTYQRRSGGIRIPFSFNLFNKGIIGEKDLEVTIFDDRDRIISRKVKDLSFMQLGDEGILSKINNLDASDTEARVSISFDFKNHSDAGNFIARATIFKDRLKKDIAFQKDSGLQEVAVGGENTFTLDFQKPQQPQLYYVSLQVLRDGEIPETGVLEWVFRTEGAFATINHIQVTPKRFLNAGEKMTVDVIGYSDKANQSLTAAITARTQENDPENKTQFFSGKFPLPVSEYRDFSQKFTLPLLWEAGQVWGEVIIFKGDQIIGRKEFVTEKYRAPERSLVEDIIDSSLKLFEKSPVGDAQRDFFLAVAGVILALIIIGIVVVRLIKKKRLFSIGIILLIGSLVSSNVRADILVDDYTYDSPQVPHVTLPPVGAYNDALAPFYVYYRTTGSLSSPFDIMGIFGDSTDAEELFLAVGEDVVATIFLEEHGNIADNIFPDDTQSAEYGGNYCITSVGHPYTTTPMTPYTIESEGHWNFQFHLGEFGDAASNCDILTTQPILDDERAKFQITSIFIEKSDLSSGILLTLDGLSGNPDPFKFFINNVEPKVRFSFENAGSNPLGDPSSISDKEDHFTNNPSEITDYYTNQEITVTVSCGYTDQTDLPSNITDTVVSPIANNNADTHICEDGDNSSNGLSAEGGANGETFKIKGNFCSDPTECDTTATRIFKICDVTGNCNETNVHLADGTEIRAINYDVTPPAFGGMQISNGDAPSDTTYHRTDNSPIAAINNYIFKALDIRDGETDDNTTADVDLHSCGFEDSVNRSTLDDDGDDFFWNNTAESNCHPKQIACAIAADKRGIIDYLEDPGTGWEEVLVTECAQECEVGETAVYCNDADKALNIKRCCSANCANIFPFEFPLCFT